MNAPRRVGIRGTGSYVPERVLSNEDLQSMVDTSDEWITTRTGIKERRLVADGENASDMAVAAAKRALEAAGMTADQLGLILVATVSGDYLFPSTACLVQAKLGAPQVGCVDLGAACSGFVYALSTAHAMASMGVADNILVVGVEALSRITDYEDRASCILFGDGAGAVIVSSEFDRAELLSSSLAAEGEGEDVIKLPAGGTARPASHDTVDEKLHTMRLRGREVYKFAVSKMVKLVENAKTRHDDLELGYVVPHQVNLRIIESARQRLELREDQVFVNIHRYGNTSAASIPIGLDEAVRGGVLDPHSGRLVVLCAFGAGLTWGSVSLKW